MIQVIDVIDYLRNICPVGKDVSGNSSFIKGRFFVNSPLSTQLPSMPGVTNYSRLFKE